MKKTLITTLFVLLLALLAACAPAQTATPVADAAPTGVPEYQPTGPTIHFHRLDDGDPVTEGNQPNVGVSFSGFPTDDPNVVTPIHVSVTGKDGYSSEGIDYSFDWNLEEMYLPALYDRYDDLCSYHFDAVIGGRPAITQHYGTDGDSCYVEFVYSD